MRDKSILGVKTWRTDKGISLDAVAASTKIGIRILEAIEAGDFKRLPGGIYNTNYIKQYANAIEFNEASLLDFYHNSCRIGSAPTLRVQYS
jgi:cytoskeletal protein RodZ